MTSKHQKHLSFNLFLTKTLILCSVFLIPFLGFCQSEIDKKPDTFKVEALSIEVTIDSVEELKTTFEEQDLEELFMIMEADEEIAFKLNCTFEEAKDKLKGSMTYVIKGKANEKEKLKKSIKKAKATVLKFYNLKNKK